MGDTAADRYLWTDTETTSADYGTCAVLETCWYVTDMDLRDVGHRLEQRFCSIVGALAPGSGEPYPWDDLMEQAPDVVVKMHEGSGLAGEWNAAYAAREMHVSGAELAADILSSIEAHVPAGGRLFIAGDGVGHFDRLVYDSVAPSLGERLHYRPQGDISPTVRLLSRGQWGPAEFLRNNAAAEAAVMKTFGPIPMATALDSRAVEADHRAVADTVRALIAGRCLLEGGVIAWPGKM